MSREYLHEHKACKLKKGDTVFVTHIATDEEQGWENMWDPEMDGLVGKQFMIVADSGSCGFELDTGKYTEYNYDFPYFVLSKNNVYVPIKI